MNGKLSWAIFWALIGVFIVIVGVFSIPPLRDLIMGFPFILVSGVVFFLLGLALIVLTVKEKVGGILKKFFLLTGAAAIGIPLSILLHNAIYGLCIHFFGADFWHRIGLGDEPVFFTIAVIICLVAFLVGAVGSIVLAVKKSRAAKQPEAAI